MLEGHVTRWTKTEERVWRRLDSPMVVQEFLDRTAYTAEVRYRSPRAILQDRRGNCFDGAVFAAAALRRLGYPPLLLELIPNRRDDDHLIAPFRERGLWGAVAKSNYSGLRWREPVYRGLRELVMSYFEDFFNIARERTLRGFGAPLRLARFDRLDWERNDAALDVIAAALDGCRKTRILAASQARRLTQVDKRTFRAGLLGLKQAEVFRPR